MPNNQTQMPKEGLYIIPQKKQKLVKMNYGKKFFDPHQDQKVPSIGSRKGSSLDSRISNGRKVTYGGRNPNY